MNSFTFNRLYALLLLCGSVLFICYAGCKQTVNRPIRLGMHPWVGYQTLNVCAQSKVLKPELVQIIHTNSISTSVDLLLKDGVDAAALTLAEVLELREKGIPLSVVLIFDTSAGADLLLARPHISNLAELKGATIGMEDSVLGHFMLREVLQRAGLKRTDVKLRFEAVERHDSLWDDQEIDALITYIPLPENTYKNSRILFDSSAIPEAIIDVLAVRSDRMDQFSRALEHLTSAHFKIVKKIHSGSPDTLHRIAACLGTSVRDTSYSLRNIIIPGLEYNHTLLEMDINPQLKQSATRILNIMHPQMQIKPQLLKDLASSKYLPETLE